MTLNVVTKRIWSAACLLALPLLSGGPARAADYGAAERSFGGRGEAYGVELPPRYFPRVDEDARAVRKFAVPPRRLAGCIPRRAPIPTDAWNDPSYVGSAYGLGKPSYYGFTPPLGVDDPYGRPLLPYCP
ncbi:hypothetical protein [Methylobacterium gossipiicola]|uniref:Uncharacterized protein n=1 Tax=Methylobacterium gossipiicola TaxID=582675 RepID=A0A1I2RNL4_9HYPH|nr:hypothetical protein [Methylobacterium gossipiicola]SFG42102.1 hypothetical protein SAMN05192565_10331 [Methylobacterium gossipiicola]